jgi:hypothetical protein
MIRLKATTPEEIQQEFIDRKRDIAVEIECPIPVDISAQKKDYDKALKTNSETLLEYEEYELLERIKVVTQKK